MKKGFGLVYAFVVIFVVCGLIYFGENDEIPRNIAFADYNNEYYVSLVGSDSDIGSIDSPFRTINYAVNQMSASGGDVVYVMEGRYYESVYNFVNGVDGNPNTLMAYNGENVVIDGSELISNWAEDEPNVYVAPILFQSNLIFEGDDQLIDALEPDIGFFGNIGDDSSDVNKIISSYFEQFSGEDLSGAILYLYYSYSETPYYRTQYTVSDNGNNWVSLVGFNSSQYDFENNDYSFVLKNHKFFVDEQDEYFIDNVNSNVYLFSNSAPMNIYASKINRAIDFSAKQYINTFGLNVIKNNERGLHISSGSHNILVEDMRFSDDVAQNIYISQSNDIELRDISLEKSNSYNIYTNDVTNLNLEDFLIYGGKSSYAVFLDNTDHFTVQNGIFKDCLKSCFIIDESEDGYVDYISFEKEFSDYSFDTGVYIPYSTNIFLSNIETNYGLGSSLHSYSSEDIVLDNFNFINTIEEKGTILIGNTNSFIIQNGYIANTLSRAISITHSFNGLIDNIEMVNDLRGIDITGGSESIVVQNSYAHDTLSSGSSAFSSHQAKHITFQNNVVKNWYGNGFLSEGYWDNYRAENITIRNNYVYHVGPQSDDDLVDSWMAGIWISDTDDSTFVGNTIIQNRAINLRLDSSKNNIIENNVLIGQHAQGHEQTEEEISCFYMGAGGNTSTEYYALNNIFSHNTLYGCGNGIRLAELDDYEGATVEDNTITNNIIFNAKDYYVYLYISHQNAIDNNIYYGQNGNYSFRDYSTVINNFGEYQNQTGYDLSSRVIDPLLENIELYDEIEFFENRGNYFAPTLDGPVCDGDSYVGAIPCYNPSNDEPSSGGSNGGSSSNFVNDNSSDYDSQTPKGGISTEAFYAAIYFVQSHTIAMVLVIAIIITVLIGANRIYFRRKKKVGQV
jgi:parallel beta-helix repeat protein